MYERIKNTESIERELIDKFSEVPLYLLDKATRKWVDRFNEVPLSLIERAFRCSDDWCEITPIIPGDTVCYNGKYMKVDKVDLIINRPGSISIHSKVFLNKSKIAVEYYDVETLEKEYFPKWNTLWSFKNYEDKLWVMKNLSAVAECGFRIFEDEQTGDIYVGIDGDGHNIYDTHWIPLYKRKQLSLDDEE